MTWEKREQIDCPCGMPGFIDFFDDEPHLVCIFHAPEAGAIFKLPKEKPEPWPPASREEFINILMEAEASE